MGSGKLFHFWVNTFFIDQQRSSPLSHSYIQAKPNVTCPSPASSAAKPGVPGLGWPQGGPEERNSRSAHNSGGTLGPDSPLPPPRMLRHTLSDNHGHGHHASGSSGSMEDQVSYNILFTTVILRIVAIGDRLQLLLVTFQSDYLCLSPIMSLNYYFHQPLSLFFACRLFSEPAPCPVHRR